MSDLTKLVGLDIQGQFLRNPAGVENSLKGLEAESEFYSPEELEKKRIEIERGGKLSDFSLRIFYADKNTGLFVARAKDDFGISGIAGLMLPAEKYAGVITFQKSYLRSRDSFSGRGGGDSEKIFKDNLRQIFYSGQHWIISGKLFEAKGKYLSDGLNYLGGGGTWEMSVKLPQ